MHKIVKSTLRLRSQSATCLLPSHVSPSHLAGALGCLFALRAIFIKEPTALLAQTTGIPWSSRHALCLRVHRKR